MSVSLSTEDVVNRVAAKPSLKFLSIVVGIMSFQIMKAMVAYFPNLGGYIPYEEWRCVVGSMTCYERVSLFKIQDYKAWPDNKMVELDDRCMITVSNIDTKQATLHLHGHSGNDIGSINIQRKSENLVISISSNSSCDDQKKELCEKEIKGKIMDLDTLECTLQFAGTKTSEDRTTLTCNGVRFDLKSELDDGEVYSLIDAVQTVRFISVEGEGEYQLNCPGTCILEPTIETIY
ncbi:uncharacterized protein LOC134814675 [Bolinopsis microptera]|uniref:uncharacterized protein LOC134814675 n=1 Tax=Bolinopsis microptera TaxID=2820187 RepID=UPI0030799DE5